MSCACKQKLSDFLNSLKNLPLNALMQAITPLPQLPALPALTGLAAGLTNLSATASASASASARLALTLPTLALPPLALPRLEALAMLSASANLNLGAPGVTSASLSLSLQRMALSLNANLPSLMQLLAELLGPVLEALTELANLLQALQGVQAAFGVNLMLPGAMPSLGLALSARLSAAVSAHASLSAAVGLPLALGNLLNFNRLFNACAALGINLSAAGAMPRLSAALSLAAGLPIPPITLSLPALNALANFLAALRPLTSSSLGFNLALPNAAQLLAAALAALQANLGMSLGLSASAMASLTAAANFGLTLGGAAAAFNPSFMANVGLAASLNARLAGLPWGLLPDLPALALAARFGQATGLSIWSSSPCSGSCPVGKMF